MSDTYLKQLVEVCQDWKDEAKKERSQLCERIIEVLNQPLRPTWLVDVRQRREVGSQRSELVEHSVHHPVHGRPPGLAMPHNLQPVDISVLLEFLVGFASLSTENISLLPG